MLFIPCTMSSDARLIIIRVMYIIGKVRATRPFSLSSTETNLQIIVLRAPAIIITNTARRTVSVKYGFHESRYSALGVLFYFFLELNKRRVRRIPRAVD